MIHQPFETSLKPVLAAALCAGVFALVQLVPVSHAQSSAPTLNGPSTAAAEQTVTFSGRGYAPNTAITIAVVQPGGLETHFSGMVAADGTVSYTLKPASAGLHALKVLNSGGVVLAKTVMNVL
jgi:hypothetical protein